jgi:hypothetical protein
MAEIIGDEEAYNEGMYSYAKLAALRMAIFRSSQNYFHKYFGVEPYWVSKCFNEELDSSKAFINVPSTYDAYRPGSIYNMTTEGHYPEAFEMYSSFLKDEIKDFLKVVEDAYGGGLARAPLKGEFSNYVCGMSNLLSEQELFSWFMMALDTGYYPCEKLLKMLDEASAGHRLSEEFLGASFSHRRVPAKWTYCFLKSQIQGSNFPVSITGWRGLRINSAEYDEANATAKFEIDSVKENAWLELKLKKDFVEIKMPEVSLRTEESDKKSTKIYVKSQGYLEIKF